LHDENLQQCSLAQHWHARLRRPASSRLASLTVSYRGIARPIGQKLFNVT